MNECYNEHRNGADNMNLEAVLEYNEKGCLVYLQNLPGAFSQGKTAEEAFAKLPAESARFEHWKTGKKPPENFEHECTVFTVLKKESTLNAEDADSDVIFDTERQPLSLEEYERQKALALKSTRDFQRLYDSVPDKSIELVQRRTAFFGKVPQTAEEMYAHTMNVNSYYFGEAGINAENGPDILSCREKGFAALERQPDFLKNSVRIGSYDEEWSLYKVLRRFIWHDRIHAKAMYRGAAAIFGKENICDSFFFGE